MNTPLNPLQSRGKRGASTRRLAPVGENTASDVITTSRCGPYRGIVNPPIEGGTSSILPKRFSAPRIQIPPFQGGQGVILFSVF